MRRFRTATAAVFFFLGAGRMWATLAGWRNTPSLVTGALALVEPLRSVNGYGLFAVMTMRRPEIILEGSDDGTTWKAYEFKWKPGDPLRRPAFLAPHMPRLDWQMWFAALGRYQDNRWFLALAQRLLEGEPRVLALLKENPFPKAPPRYLRATVYEYVFTTTAERRATGAWWKREVVALYCPVLSLKT